LCKGFTQGGSNADNVITDAFLKINTTAIDWKLAYEAIVKDAEEEPFGMALFHWDKRQIKLTQT
jgi:putative alpha-1,2-mannosidase